MASEAISEQQPEVGGVDVIITLRDPSLAYSFYVVAILSVAYMLSFMDRTLISLLIAPIKAEFSLSDTQVGLLIGFGFVLFYSVLGLPFGALADRADRRWLMILGLVAWSFATSASGLAGGFAGLMAMRMLVGVGEATLSPSAYSTIADRFPPRRLGLAVAICAMGVSIGGGLAMVFGGALVSWAASAEVSLPLVGIVGGWRLTLIIVGLLGLPLALLMVMTISEAPRKTRSAPPSWTALGTFFRTYPRALIGAIVAFGLANIANYVVFLWVPALFMRVHGLDAQTTGLMIGSIVGVMGSLGMLMGGALVDRLVKRGVIDAPLRVILWCVVLQLPLMPVAFLTGSATVAAWLLVPTMVLTTAASSIQATALQMMTPPLMRGRVIAIFLLIITVIGMGVGPLAIGMLSDHVFTQPTGLAPAMALVAAAGLLSAALLLAWVVPSVRALIEAQDAEARPAS